MNNDQNRDLYEILEVSPNASQETIERMFRYFAQRYHPDRESTGDADRFRQVVKAYDTLKEPESRAAYDSRHQTNFDYQWSLVEEAGDHDNFANDSIIQERVLSVLYTKRKRDPRDPGLGQAPVARDGRGYPSGLRIARTPPPRPPRIRLPPTSRARRRHARRRDRI